MDQNATERLCSMYRQLAPHEQATVQILAVAYEPTTKSAVYTALRQLGVVHDDKYKALTNERTLNLLEWLADTGVILREDYRYRCPPALGNEVMTSLIKASRLTTVAAAFRKTLKLPTQGPRELREALFGGDFTGALALWQTAGDSMDGALQAMLTEHFDERWMRTWPAPILTRALSSLLEHSFAHFTPPGRALSFLVDICGEAQKNPEQQALLAVVRSLRGEAQHAQGPTLTDAHPASVAAATWLAFLRRDVDTASAGLRKLEGRADTSPWTLVFKLGFLGGVLALLEQGDKAAVQAALARVPASGSRWWVAVLPMLRIWVQESSTLTTDSSLSWKLDHGGYNEPPLAQFFRMTVRAWFGILREPDLMYLQHSIDQATAAGHAWMAAELQDIVASAQKKPRSGQGRMLGVAARNEPWRRALDALDQLVKQPVEEPAPQQEKPRQGPVARLGWVLTSNDHYCSLRPIEQRRDAKGAWTQGRRVALQKLHEASSGMPYLTEQDRRILGALTATTYRSRGYPETTYDFDTEKALRAMLGHPAVYLDGEPLTHVHLSEGSLTLTVIEQGDEIEIKLVPRPAGHGGVALLRESPTQVKVVFPSEKILNYAKIIGAGLRVPSSERARVSRLIGQLSSAVAVQSTLAGAGEQSKRIAASSAPVVLLQPVGAGLVVRLKVRPFSTPEPQFTPGAGAEVILAEVNGKRLQTQRSLAEERAGVERLLAACPTLQRWPELDGARTVASSEDALELLAELAQQPGLSLDWVSGRPWELHHVRSFEHLSLRFASEEGGFRVDGDLRLGGKEKLELGKLLELLETSPGRFVKLAEHSFVALTQECRQRLDELTALSERRGKKLLVSPLAGALVEPWLSQCGAASGDARWKALLSRLREAQALDPEVPPTLRAELRPYQIDGFRWLTRLAHGGGGACLADDMGLGKTVQALALLLARAPAGPALVVAPTSVGLGWIDEAARFAPTLRCTWLADADRKKTLEKPGPLDVVVCSYGLLLQEIEPLAKVDWHTIVLDEAQAIKNMATRRSAAAMRLRGAFRLATTGTPVENNLAELWNLFRFLNPGLLGSLEAFNQRFADPIEQRKDRDAGRRLTRLLQPFLLRRTKSQVLTELPARTDVLLRVDLSAEEAALYEALRGRALAELGSNLRSHVEVLAELTRLRRACCHPRLVDPTTKVDGAKLAAFAELQQELRGAGHRALVFSQFVDHLQIVRSYLDEQKVRYQYLDGSTPAAERKRRVDAFQGGEGELFLISLKAGGTGLNLTGADFVIHLDPWWNPSVEDQATDRAHRIGQSRPVTVYRLVARHTIEEKILALHDRKRDLASRLLEGTDVGGSLSVEELLQLLREN